MQDWLVFDLGGVLMNFTGMDALSELTGRPVSDIHDLLLHSVAVKDFQTGRVEPDVFSVAMVAELELSLSPDELLHLWAEWEAGPMTGALDLLDRLGRENAIACLSNTNILHWQRLTSRYGLLERFERCFVSHEIGLSKPDPRIFEHVVADLRTPPHRITYFDDNAEIIEAAIAFGFDAHRVDSPQDIELVLSK